MSLWAIIPIKPLRKGKSRLATILSEEERIRLNQELLIRTLDSLRKVQEIDQTLVISYDTAALTIARDYGARTIQENRRTSMNRSLRRATVATKAFNASKILVLPADLPLINEKDINKFISKSGSPPEVVIAADRKLDGTNALLINPIGIIDYDFGPWSFKKHIEQVQRKNIRLEICNLESLGFDLDLPEDLYYLMKKKKLKIDIKLKKK
jgi:2-phospho-L-lactate guanylyltransferase